MATQSDRKQATKEKNAEKKRVTKAHKLAMKPEPKTKKAKATYHKKTNMGF